jgi:excisionase family DNA binding protein
MNASRKSFRVAELAKRNALSISFIYKEISNGRLRAHKAGAATIITTDDEQAWLNAMPTIGASVVTDKTT